MSSLHNWYQREEQTVADWNVGLSYIELLESDYGVTSTKRFLRCHHERIQSLLKMAKKTSAHRIPEPGLRVEAFPTSKAGEF